MTRTELDDFENALLTDLRQELDGRGAMPPPHRRRRGLAVTGAIGTAAVAVVLSTAMLQPSDAFAVKPQADGGVVVTIDEFSDAAGLEKALEDKGVEADVDYDAQRGEMVEKEPEEQANPSRPGSDTGNAEVAQGPPQGACAVDVTVAEDGSTTFRLQREIVDSSAKLKVELIGAAEDGVVGVAWSGGPC